MVFLGGFGDRLQRLALCPGGNDLGDYDDNVTYDQTEDGYQGDVRRCYQKFRQSLAKIQILDQFSYLFEKHNVHL